MNPYTNLLDPFGGGGVPGDPMERVLSLQTYALSDDGGTAGNTGNCTNTGNCGDTTICTDTTVCGNTTSCGNTKTCGVKSGIVGPGDGS